MDIPGIYKGYQQERDKLMQMGGPKAIVERHKRGQMSARERIDYFFDPDTFTEIGLFVKHRTSAFWGWIKEKYLLKGLSLLLRTMLPGRSRTFRYSLAVSN